MGNRLAEDRCLYCGEPLIAGGPALFHLHCIPDVEAMGNRIVERKDSGKRKRVKICFPSLRGLGPLKKMPKGGVRGLPGDQGP